MSVATLPARPAGRPLGWWGMVFVIATEATLFAVLLASYFYLRFKSPGAWPPDGIADPKLLKPAVMTVFLMTSSLTVWYGERAVRRDDMRGLRVGLALTFLLGIGFLALQFTEYRGAAAGDPPEHGRVRVVVLHDHRPARRPRRRRPAAARVDAVLRLARRLPQRGARRGSDLRALLALRPRRLAVPVPGPLPLPAAVTARGGILAFAVLGASARLGGAARQRLRHRGGRVLDRDGARPGAREPDGDPLGDQHRRVRRRGLAGIAGLVSWTRRRRRARHRARRPDRVPRGRRSARRRSSSSRRSSSARSRSCPSTPARRHESCVRRRSS